MATLARCQAGLISAPVADNQVYASVLLPGSASHNSQISTFRLINIERYCHNIGTAKMGGEIGTLESPCQVAGNSGQVTGLIIDTIPDIDTPRIYFFRGKVSQGLGEH